MRNQTKRTLEEAMAKAEVIVREREKTV